MLCLQKYDITISYTPGKLMVTADALSRAVDTNSLDNQYNDEEMWIFVDTIISSLHISEQRMEQIPVQLETRKDKTLNILKEVILNGWPDAKSDCQLLIHDYWNWRNELSVIYDMIMKGSKIVIPQSLRRLMLSKIHEGHYGLNDAKDVMYQDIAINVSNCPVKYKPKQQPEPLLPNPIQEWPYQKVGTDLCMHKGKYFLLITDYYLSYPEVIQLTSTTSKAVITSIKAVFARHDVPEQVFSDNGP